MIRSPRGALTAAVQRVLREWNRVPMRIQSRITVCLPLIAVSISACVALMGNIQRVEIETDIQRKFEMTAALGDLTTLMVNAETGMRGYLLTEQGEFLEPFDRASAELPAGMARLTGLAAAEPGARPRADKLGRVEHLRTLTGQQLEDLALQPRFIAAGGPAGAQPGILPHLEHGKSLMDQIRYEVEAMQAEERGLLSDRIADINAIRVRDYVSVVVVLIVAAGTRLLAWYLFRRGTLRRVEQLTENVRSLRQGGPLPFPPQGRQDELGQLESEIHLIRS